jgi:FtsP/CotA-like multicopper oxidase with cupredoxin domain
MSDKTITRRQFLTVAGIAGIGLGIAACESAPVTPPPPSAMPGMDMSGTPGVAATPVEDMDAMHEAGVKAFVGNLEANNKTFWPQKLPFSIDGNTKVFNLTCKEVVWTARPGEQQTLPSYNGLIPGPEIRVSEGDNVRVFVKNELKESTVIHWHGVHTPNAMDGVPFVTQPPIKPGQSFTYEFVAKPAGSHMYHSHHNAADQVTLGLLGSFIIEPKDKSREPKVDSDYTMVLNDTGVGLTINGKSFPATGAILAKRGEKVRVRFMNEGLIIHPWHLHGMYMQVISQDGAPLPQPYLCDTLNIAPGQRFDVIIDCQEPGVWAFHCHVLTHAESPHGMFGMVSAVIIQ